MVLYCHSNSQKLMYIGNVPCNEGRFEKDFNKTFLDLINL